MSVREAARTWLGEDADVVGRVRAGEPDAYAVLVRRYQRLLYRHTRGMGLDHDTGLDMVQDAFVKAYTCLEECREPGHFRAWLFRICRNLCLDHLKNIRRRSVSLDAMGEEAALAPVGGPRAAARHMLWEALDSLPADLREAFLLKHEMGYTYEEVAEMVDLTPSAAKMRVHRARRMLVDFLSRSEKADAVGDDLGVSSRLWR